MESQIKFRQIKYEDSQAVISFNNGATFKIDKLMEKINLFFRCNFLCNLSSQLKQDGLGTPPDYQQQWNNSVEAEILEPKSGEWKKGKIRMRVLLEFCPDEPEEIANDGLQGNNSLDDIRQTIS